MKTAALKTASSPRVSRQVMPSCPAEACLREWAEEKKRWRKFVKTTGHKPWGFDEVTGRSEDSPEFRAHCEMIRDIEERATWVLATSQIGAAYQALLMYSGTPDLTETQPPVKLSKAQQAVIDRHDEKTCRLTLSVYLRLRVQDHDLLMRESYMTGPDSLQEVLTDAGFDLLPVAA